MEPFNHITGSTFQYTDVTALMEHTDRASPSGFRPVLQSQDNDSLASDFDYLGDRLCNHTSEILATAGLFHLKAYARQMLEFDAGLRRRSDGGEWADRDLFVIRTSLSTIAGIANLPRYTASSPRTAVFGASHGAALLDFSDRLQQWTRETRRTNCSTRSRLHRVGRVPLAAVAHWTGVLGNQPARRALQAE